MNKIYTRLLHLIVLVFFTFTLTGQNQHIVKNNDSINEKILHNFNQKIALFEKQRIADSINKANLEEQLILLKTTDGKRKNELQKQIQGLKVAEATRLLRKKAQIDSLRLVVKGSPVIGFFNDTLFFIYSKIGSFSAKERADAISQRIKKLTNGLKLKSDSIYISESETTTDLVSRETILMSISENDALWNNLTKKQLARNYQQIISQSILKYKSETSLVVLAKEIGLALLVILITVILIYFTGKFFNWTALQIKKQEDNRIKGFKIRDYTLFDAKRLLNLLLRLNTVLKWIAILFIIYIALPILFGIFPWTKNFAETLIGYVLNPVKNIAGSLWNYLPNLITIIVILIVFRYILKGIYFLKSEIEKGDLNLPGFYPDWANPTYQIIRILVYAFMIVAIFQYLPLSDSPVFRGVSVFLGFLFTFGSAGSLSNIVAGLVITYMRLFKIGDRVKIGDVTGDVIEKSVLVTRIRTIKNEIISIPNSTVMSNHTINYSSEAPEKGLIIHTTVTIGYDVPWRDMHQALIDAALKTDYVLHEPLPFVLQTSLDDFFVSYQINAYTKEATRQATIYSDLHQNIQDVCNERGIEILSPHYRSARDGNATAIPSSYLPKDYQAPGFNVNIKKDPKLK